VVIVVAALSVKLALAVEWELESMEDANDPEDMGDMNGGTGEGA